MKSLPPASIISSVCAMTCFSSPCIRERFFWCSSSEYLASRTRIGEKAVSSTKYLRGISAPPSGGEGVSLAEPEPFEFY